MSKWYIGKIGKTELSVHPGMLLYMIYAWVSGHGMYMVISTISILLHEGAHAICAALFGKPPGSIELTPMGAIMYQEDEFALPTVKRTIMLLAGPTITAVLCMLAIALTKRALISNWIGYMIFTSNLSILILNLLPAYPLDGGRIIALLFGLVFPLRTVNIIMRYIGTGLGVGLIVMNIILCWNLGGWNLSLAFAGCCLMYSAIMGSTSRVMAELHCYVERKIRLERKGMLPARWFCVLSNASLRNVVKRLPGNQWGMFLCIEPGSMKQLGWLTEAEVIQQYLRAPESTIKEALKKCINCCAAVETVTN